MLVLIPPSMKNTAAQREKLETFLGRCPDRLRVAVEFRDASWQSQEVYDLLEQHDAALVVVDAPGVTTVPRITASFVYARLHGTDPVNKFAGLYSEQVRRSRAEWQLTPRSNLRSGRAACVAGPAPAVTCTCASKQPERR